MQTIELIGVILVVLGLIGLLIWYMYKKDYESEYSQDETDKPEEQVEEEIVQEESELASDEYK